MAMNFDGRADDAARNLIESIIFLHLLFTAETQRSPRKANSY
jgi:hypothetical protein